MAKGGYIYLEKKIQDHWIYKDKPFNKAMAWIDMLLIADHQTHTTIWRGNPTEFKRGDVNLSITELAKRWGWSRNKARNFILALEKDGMVTTNRTPNRTVITIVKYEVYQNKRTPNRTPNETPNRTPDRTADETYLSNNKGINNEIKKSDTAASGKALVAEEDDEEPPVPGAARLPNGGWDYRPEVKFDDELEEDET